MIEIFILAVERVNWIETEEREREGVKKYSRSVSEKENNGRSERFLLRREKEHRFVRSFPVFARWSC
jgi:hypothetical protein